MLLCLGELLVSKDSPNLLRSILVNSAPFFPLFLGKAQGFSNFSWIQFSVGFVMAATDFFKFFILFQGEDFANLGVKFLKTFLVQGAFFLLAQILVITD